MMSCVRLCFVFLVTLSFFDFCLCGRFSSRGGGSRGGFRSPSHHPSPSHYSPPSYHPPPSYRPVSSYHPATSYHPAPSHHSPPPRPRPSPPPRHNPSPRPNPPPYEPPSRVVTSRPVQSHKPGVSTARPIHRPVGSTYRSNTNIPRTTSRPIYSPGTSRRPTYVGSSPRPQRYSTPRPTFNNLPPRPGSRPVGPPSYNTYSPGPQKVKIVNKYNYHYPGYYSMPVQHSYPGYYYTQTYYHYSPVDTGNTALGFYLGYSLGKLTTPTYSHYSFYDGYRPQYDHYTVYHYHYNRESVPQNQEIRANTIVGCVGDSASICPANTTSLCTSNGALMCVASAVSTTPCSDNRQVNCVTSTITCVNNAADECKNSKKNSTTISIPCVSTANVYGDIKYVNNTIIPANATTVGIVPSNNSVTNSTVNGNNGTLSGNNSNTSFPQGSPTTKYPVTTTPVYEDIKYVNNTATNGTVNGNNGTLQESTPVSHVQRKRREVPKDYCVTILALPAKRQPTPGEDFLDDALFISEKFIENVWNL